MHSYLLSLFPQLSGAVNQKSNCINYLILQSVSRFAKAKESNYIFTPIALCDCALESKCFPRYNQVWIGSKIALYFAVLRFVLSSLVYFHRYLNVVERFNFTSLKIFLSLAGLSTLGVLAQSNTSVAWLAFKSRKTN